MIMSQTRMLGWLESFLAPPYLCNVVAPTKLRLKRPIDRDVLQNAVLLTIKAQPNLSAGVIMMDKTLYFSPLLDMLDYFEVLPSNTSWEHICAKYSNTLLRENCKDYPPLKVFFIPISMNIAYIIPVCAHHAADGTNGMTIVDDILKTYTALRGGVDIVLEQFDPPLSVSDVSSRILGEKYNEVKNDITEYAHSVYKEPSFNIPFEEDESTEVDALYYTSSKVAYNNFLCACRKNRVTVGCALLAVQYFSYACYLFYNLEDLPDEIFLKGIFPVNYRGRVDKEFDIPANCANLFTSNFLMGIPVSRSSRFWDFARQVKKMVDDLVSRKFYMIDFFSVKEIIDSHAVQKALQEDRVKFQFTVSNMKSYPSSLDYEDFTVESIHCVGGNWLRNNDVMELMVYSTDKFNLSMIHRCGDANTQRAQYVFRRVQFFVENVEKLENDTLQNCMDKMTF